MEEELIGLIDYGASYLIGEIDGPRFIPGPQGPAGQGLNKLGYAFIQDGVHSALNPFIVEENSRVKLPNDGLGVLTDLNSVPVGSNWFDKDNSKFLADALGDFFYYRVNIIIVPMVNNKSLSLDFDIGTPNQPFVETIVLTKGAGVPTKRSFVIPIAAGNALKNNGGTLNIWSETEVHIYGINVLIHKAFSK
jgi:hypothetical protein